MSYIHENRMKFFFEAVNKGSVRAAADALDVAPSAVSRQISQLEQALAVTLIERHRRGIKPTEAGEEVLKYYKGYLLQQEVLLEQLQSLQGLQKGHIVIAMGEGYLDDISVLLSEFSSQFPEIKLHLSICSSNEVTRNIVEDDAHIGLVFNPARDPKIRSHFIMNHPLSIIVHKSHPLAGMRNIELDQLTQYRLALTDATHGIRQIIAQVENNTGMLLSPTLECNNLSTLKAYVINGGVTLLPQYIFKNHPHLYPDLVAISLINPIFSQTKSHIITRLGRQLGTAANKLLQMLIYKMQALNKH